jgi:cytochrome c oxidase assembly protein subunit 15
MIDSERQARYDRQVAAWLLLCAAVVLGMILLGGVTRLTGSGLSMVEWKPLMGVIPPLSEEAWLETFGKYKQFPEYREINPGMDLAGFKSIFMYEYLHRMLGRLIGVLFLLPMLFFWLTGRLRQGLKPRLAGLFVLGGLQGLLGWYMVKSGLVNDPHVSQYRLTAHLGLAVAIYAAMLWFAFDLLPGQRRQFDARAAHLGGLAAALVALVYLMILSGGLVAGTRAGYAFSTWPLMGSGFLPPGLYGMEPLWRSAFEDIATVQFNHRVLAYLLFLLIGAYCIAVVRSQTRGRARAAAICTGLALLTQLGLGISTLLLHVPVPLAAAHQLGAVVLLSCLLYSCHCLRRQVRGTRTAVERTLSGGLLSR